MQAPPIRWLRASFREARPDAVALQLSAQDSILHIRRPVAATGQRSCRLGQGVVSISSWRTASDRTMSHLTQYMRLHRVERALFPRALFGFGRERHDDA